MLTCVMYCTQQSFFCGNNNLGMSYNGIYIECTSSAGIWYEHVYYLGELWNLLISHYLLQSFLNLHPYLQCTHARLGCSLIILSEIAWLSTLYILS